MARTKWTSTKYAYAGSPSPNQQKRLAYHIMRKKSILRTLKTEKNYLLTLTSTPKDPAVDPAVNAQQEAEVEYLEKNIAAHEDNLKTELSVIADHMYLDSLKMISAFAEEVRNCIGTLPIDYEVGMKDLPEIREILDQFEMNSYGQKSYLINYGNKPTVIRALQVAKEFAQDLYRFMEPLHEDKEAMKFIVKSCKQEVRAMIYTGKIPVSSPAIADLTLNAEPASEAPGLLPVEPSH